MQPPKSVKRLGQQGRIPAHKMPEYLPPAAHQAVGQRLDSEVQIQLYRHRSTTQDLIIPAVAEPLLVLVVSGGARVEERTGGEEWTAHGVTADDFFLTMSPEPYEMRWRTDGDAVFEVVHVYLSQRLLGLAAREVLVGQAGAIRLRDVSGARDAQVSQLMRCLYQEVINDRDASPLYLHGIGQALAVHLVRHYRDDSGGLKQANALPAYKLHGAIEYMGARLDRNFSLSSLAMAAGMSDFHFSRLFRRATGWSPSQYFIQMRMRKARQLLLESTLSIVDIALEVGYGSPSHFAQVFRRHTGATPREYRQQ
ncbi:MULTISPECIES: helix-turn-helix domain-containing protein [unclassified Pseudomonas]|uniref:helix-turn-helix domain-containing protein n=1 Tax=unclassified Pseudomonas TaxID=196821 RepID=UPI00210BA84E|nr:MULTISPECIES: helix-turn-helix domain-containing protein [unclassified Pseudomonas]